MRLLLAIAIALGCPTSNVAQVTADSLVIGKRVERFPSFPGGEAALHKYLDRHVRMPESARSAGIAGLVYLTFLIDSTGMLRDPEVKRGLGHGCDEEALRVVRAMPRWEPGTVLGRPNDVQFVFPIRFDGRTRRR